MLANVCQGWQIIHRVSEWLSVWEGIRECVQTSGFNASVRTAAHKAQFISNKALFVLQKRRYFKMYVHQYFLALCNLTLVIVFFYVATGTVPEVGHWVCVCVCFSCELWVGVHCCALSVGWDVMVGLRRTQEPKPLLILPLLCHLWRKQRGEKSTWAFQCHEV